MSFTLKTKFPYSWSKFEDFMEHNTSINIRKFVVPYNAPSLPMAILWGCLEEFFLRYDIYLHNFLSGKMDNKRIHEKLSEREIYQQIDALKTESIEEAFVYCETALRWKAGLDRKKYERPFVAIGEE